MIVNKCDFCKKDIDRYHSLYHLQDVNKTMSKYSTMDVCSECLDYLYTLIGTNDDTEFYGVIL